VRASGLLRPRLPRPPAVSSRADVIEPLPEKPKGMHASTFRRLMAQARSADAALLAAMEKRFGRI
jgi:hypothetical protein